VVLGRTKSDLGPAGGCGRASEGALGAGGARDGSERVEIAAGIGTARGRRGGMAGTVHVSVESGEGLDALRALLPTVVYRSLAGGGDEVPVLTRRRQARAMRRARDEIALFTQALGDGLPAEVAATHLRSAESALEELVGVVSTDDVLDVVFREFCIGK